MEWVVGIQRAIDYIEDHITEELDYEEIARTGFSSSYHFQRVFSILCGYTLGEYIRSRRLTLAGMAFPQPLVALFADYSDPATTALAVGSFPAPLP